MIFRTVVLIVFLFNHKKISVPSPNAVAARGRTPIWFILSFMVWVKLISLSLLTVRLLYVRRVMNKRPLRALYIVSTSRRENALLWRAAQ